MDDSNAVNDNRSIGRVFLVGCPRSGTTLLQTLLAAHPSVVSFPETHFFSRVRAAYWPLRKIGLASRRGRRRLVEFFEEIDRPDLAPSGVAPITVRGSTGTLIDGLDRIAREHDASAWIEKTPIHLHYIPLIERHLSDARFIHIVREGIDVVASLYEVTQRFPERWGGERNIDRCIDRWKQDVEHTLHHVSRPHHTAVEYETLLRRPEPVLRDLCTFLGLDYEERMLGEYAAGASDLYLEQEEWKSNVEKRLRPPTHEKFERVFTPDEQEYIHEACASTMQQWKERKTSVVK